MSKSNVVTYTLSSVPEVNPNALEAIAGRQPDLDRQLAFELLDGQLTLLSKASGVLNLHMGRAIGPMLAGGYAHLGFSGANDYGVERLGFCRRTAELLRRQALQFDRHPVVQEAYLEGRINESSARLILNHLDALGGDAGELVALGATCTVRALREKLGELSRAGGNADARRDCPDVDRESADAAGERPPAGGSWRTYHLPPAWVATWEMVVEHFRRAEEADLRPAEVLELLAADFLAGRPEDAAMAGPFPEEASKAPGRARIDAPWDHPRSDSSFDLRRMLEEVNQCWKWLPEVPMVKVELDGRLAMPLPDDPRELDALLVELAICRRRLEVYLGRMLRTMNDYGLARMAGFASICHYAAERLGLGASTTSRLIRRDRGLIRRQKVYQAIVDGRIGLTQADLILSLPEIAPDEKGIAWAERRTCRGLEDAVHDLLEAYRLDHEAIRARGWHPPEDGEVLTTRRAPLAAARGGAADEIPSPPPEAAHSAVVAVQEAVKCLPIFSRGGEVLRIFVPDGVLPIVAEAEELASRIAGRALSPELALVAMMIGAEARYSEFERRKLAQRRRLQQKSRYRCAVPGCRRRRGLHAHHLVFRSHGGGNEDENLLMLCAFHHLRGVHEGRLRIQTRGRDYVFEMGIRDGQPAMVYAGEMRIA